MQLDKDKRRAMAAWLSVAALAILCAVLAILQYRWVGEVSRAEGERLRSSLQASLYRLGQDFNSEITGACVAILPGNSAFGEEVREEDYAARFAQWKETGRHPELLKRVAIVAPMNNELGLRVLDASEGVFKPMEWPADWKRIHARLLTRVSGDTRRGPGPPGQGGFHDGALIELPRFHRPAGDGPPRPGRREIEWLIFELNLDFIRSTLLPEVLHRHLGNEGSLQYQVEVVSRENPSEVIFHSEPDKKTRIVLADASAALFEFQFERAARRLGFRDFGRGRGPGAPGGAGGDGRWIISVQHKSGSLEAVVRRARWRNLAIVAGILLLILATVAALVRFTRQAQRLADVQMEFVAGVSHELRTPLTVIRTAAYNLRGKLAGNPNQVEKYGALIQRESERLTELVEQVLQFSSARAGRVIRDREPVFLETIIEDGIDSVKPVLDQSQARVEMDIEHGLPLVLADSVALKHAFQNLVSNAAKYGLDTDRWIGVSARKVAEHGRELIEVTVADHGPGIPADEQARIFDPFYRGKRAVQDQIHGTGLGLSLAKGIVEAHGGTISVRSQPMNGTEFVIRIPVAPEEYQNEFAHPAHRG